MHPIRLLITTAVWINAVQGLPQPQVPAQTEQAPQTVQQDLGNGGGGLWPAVWGIGAGLTGSTIGSMFINRKTKKELAATKEEVQKLRQQNTQLDDKVTQTRESVNGAKEKIQAIESKQQPTSSEPSYPKRRNKNPQPKRNPQTQRPKQKSSSQPAGRKTQGPPSQHSARMSEAQRRWQVTKQILQGQPDAEECIERALRIPLVTGPDDAILFTGEQFNIAARACGFEGSLLLDEDVLEIDDNTLVDGTYTREVPARRDREGGRSQRLTLLGIPGFISALPGKLPRLPGKLLKAARPYFGPSSGHNSPVGVPAGSRPGMSGAPRGLPMKIR